MNVPQYLYFDQPFMKANNWIKSSMNYDNPEYHFDQSHIHNRLILRKIHVNHFLKISPTVNITLIRVRFQLHDSGAGEFDPTLSS